MSGAVKKSRKREKIKYKEKRLRRRKINKNIRQIFPTELPNRKKK